MRRIERRASGEAGVANEQLRPPITYRQGDLYVRVALKIGLWWPDVRLFARVAV